MFNKKTIFELQPKSHTIAEEFTVQLRDEGYKTGLCMPKTRSTLFQAILLA